MLRVNLKKKKKKKTKREGEEKKRKRGRKAEEKKRKRKKKRGAERGAIIMREAEWTAHLQQIVVPTHSQYKDQSTQFEWIAKAEKKKKI